MSMRLESTITCPHCNHRATETMPTDACQYFYECKGCGALLKPLAGDCCVFCSHGSVPCPPIQAAAEGQEDAGCCGSSARLATSAPNPKDQGEEPAMNYKLAVIILGVVLFIAAMVPYAYAPRCANPECTPTAPY